MRKKIAKERAENSAGVRSIKLHRLDALLPYNGIVTIWCKCNITNVSQKTEQNYWCALIK